KTGTNFPVVVLLSGSGPQDRDEALMGHRPFLVLADYLTRNGIAVLRFDDRGVGKSQGTYHKAGVNDFANDADAAIQYLKTRKEVNPKKIGIIGHSLGSSIAFIEAAGR
ncbi:MAG TPA: alpha/beta hydrolase, partial [Porphyromonadaceae bacterium]|nr:alpha/beta hydrolase [Porphyromonadaceae bacterium]